MNVHGLKQRDDVYVRQEWESLGICAGITGRSFSGRDMANETRRLSQVLGIGNRRILYLDQQHTPDIVIDDGAVNGTAVGDGIITDRSDLLMVIRTADCFPVFLFFPDRKVTALLHVGWKPAWRGILKNAISLFLDPYRCDPAGLHVLLGPGLERRCFEVQPDFPGLDEFGRFIVPDGGLLYLDLGGYIVSVLTEAGVRSENIHDLEICSACNTDTVYSWRREHTANRTLSFIAYNHP